MKEIELKSGYLTEEFQLFNLKDTIKKDFSFHYHDFHKVLLFFSGKVTYIIEGKSYFLKAGDILLVSAGSIHKPIIDTSMPYERLIFYIKPIYADLPSKDSICSCFEKARVRDHYLIRTDINNSQFLREIALRLFQSLTVDDFGKHMLSHSLYIEFMIYLNRVFLGKQYNKDKTIAAYDLQIIEIMKYINQNLAQDLSLSTLSEKFFLSRSRMIHKFKEETGYTLHKYILQKRLVYAKHLMEDEQIPITKAALMSGFKDYTTFYRALKKSSKDPFINSSDANFE
ncbi:MAG: AraC family transcriptional regulator [Lachnospiraceae bacterium]|nr:AraC family transcriptional regulator [Lachnospiraceae bacterium]